MLDRISDFTIKELKDPVVKGFAIENILQKRIVQAYLESKKILSGEEATELRNTIEKEIGEYIKKGVKNNLK